MASSKFFSRKHPEINKMLGYRSREDVFSLPQGFLIKGSKNVLTEYKDKVKIRAGYTKIGNSLPDGWIGTSASYEFYNDGDGSVSSLRTIYNTNTNQYKIQYIFLGESADTDLFIDLYSYSGGEVPTFAIINNISGLGQRSWSPNLQQNKYYLISSNSTLGINYWSGGTGIVSSFTSNTITIGGDFTLAQIGFDKIGSVKINGVSYNYTGLNGKQFTGVSPTPTNINNYLVIQNFNYQDLTSQNLNLEKIDIISNIYNQLFIAEKGRGQFFVSQSNTIANFGWGSRNNLRQAGEGASLVGDEAITAFIPSEGDMWVSSRNTIRKVVYTLSPETEGTYNASGLQTGSVTIYYESMTLSPVKRQENQGAQSQYLTSHINNLVVFASFEPNINSLGNVIRQNGDIQGLFNQSLQTLSEPIRNDVNNYDFTDGSIKYFKNYLYIAVPREGIFLMYNITEEKWETPQTIPLCSFSIVNGEIYGHSYYNGDTYKLFDGLNDNGQPIQAVAIFSWQDSGLPSVFKNIQEIFVQGKIATESVLDVNISYYNDNGLFTDINTFVDGTKYINTANSNTIGSDGIAWEPIGSTTKDVSQIYNFFNFKDTFTSTDYYQFKITFSSKSKNQYWEVLRFGVSPNTESINIGQNIYT